MNFKTVEIDSPEQMHQFVLCYQGTILETITNLKGIYPESHQALSVLENIVAELPYDTDTTFTVQMETMN